MALVFNATNETVHTVAFGNHFTFKPKQVKNMDEKLARFFSTERRDLGFVTLPEEFEDADFKATEAGTKAYKEKEVEGTTNYVKFLRTIAYNNLVSLKKDLEVANIKADPRAFASDGELEAMEKLANYQAEKDDSVQKKIDRIKELERKIR